MSDGVSDRAVRGRSVREGGREGGGEDRKNKVERAVGEDMMWGDWGRYGSG